MKKVFNISCICIAIIILISSLMTGCSSKSNKINTEQSSASYVENEDFQYFIDSSSAIAKADNGYYFLNSLKLYFFDTATKEAYIVCNKPNCEHTSSKCTAFFPAFNYYPFQLSYFNNKLYVLGWEEEGSNMRHNYIYEVSLDNFKRKKSTYLFDGTDTSSVSFIIHRGYIYYLKGGGANIKETTACLFRKKIGSKSKKDKAEVIYKFSGIGAELSNIKASGNNLILMNSSFSDTDGNGYKTYSLNSNYALPPFAAFFVKASSPTELKISSNSTPTKAINIIPTNFPMSKSITEPHPDKQSTEIELPNTENFRFFIKDGQLHLQNIPEAGYIKVFNMMGHCMFQKRIRQGSLVVPFTNLSGMYILQIHSANYQKHYKVVLP